MTDTHSHPPASLYWKVGGALTFLTIVSYVGDLLPMGGSATIVIVLLVAIVKATLVATFFMHLNLDWVNVKVMIISAAVLSVVLIFALMPDIGYRGRQLDPANDPATSAAVAPAHEPADDH